MRKWYPAILVAISLAASIFAYARLPERVPTHWGLHGEVNGYSSRTSATLMLPVLLLVLWGLMRGLPKIDPWRANYAKMQGAYDLVVNGVLTILAMAHLTIIASALSSISISRIAPIMVGILFVIIGNVLPRARPNFWFGIRTPWTLTNARVWERTHRVGGYIMVVAGLIILVTALLPAEIGGRAMAVVGVGAALVTVTYSYFAWKQETSR